MQSNPFIKKEPYHGDAERRILDALIDMDTRQYFAEDSVPEQPTYQAHDYVAPDDRVFYDLCPPPPGFLSSDGALPQQPPIEARWVDTDSNYNSERDTYTDNMGDEVPASFIHRVVNGGIDVTATAGRPSTNDSVDDGSPSF